jgi:hypothetical protein
MPLARRLLIVAWLGLSPGLAAAQDPAPPAEESEARDTGLPKALDWTFNLDAGWGAFGFANSLFTNPKEGVATNLSDQWFEGYVKPALSGSYTFAASSQLYGKVSAVGERTYGSVPSDFGQDVSSFQAEDLAIGWRSGDALALGENAVEVTIGRAPYQLGRGFLLYDGTAEGGSRGGYWTNARKAFQFAAIGRFRPGPHAIEAFYLDKDELEEYDTGSRLWGLNYEYRLDDDTTFGGTYMKWSAHPDLEPGRDGLQVLNLRAYTKPVRRLPGLGLDAEYAAERNGDALDSNAWTLQGSYELARATWTPTISYRYAFFQGDDPASPANEAFDPLFLGFSDWGTWWQGEIAGEYFLSNSNLVSHQVRAHVAPGDALGAGLIVYGFRADAPASYGEGVTDRDIAFETDLYADWKVNGNFTVSVVAAYADPGKAVQQATGRTKNFVYGMVYVGYAY